jgi:hypothetical protein
MESFLLEDVNELLKLKKGDNARLIRIKEACESNALVSLSDRKYVERLSTQYVNAPDPKKEVNQDRPKFVPIEEPGTVSKKNGTLGINQTPKFEKPIVNKEQIVFEKSQEMAKSKVLNLSSNQKIIFSIVSVALAIILVGVVTVGIDGIQLQDNSNEMERSSLSNFSLETDKTSYETSDIISISGKMSSSSKGTVRLFIENENKELLWEENLNLKNDGSFSTLLIAGGQGWEKSGRYFLNVEYNEFSNIISFDFIAK